MIYNSSLENLRDLGMILKNISLRKINSLLMLIVFLFLLNHAVLSVSYLYGLIPYSPDFQIAGRRLFYPLILHIAISLYLYFRDTVKKGNPSFRDTVKKGNPSFGDTVKKAGFYFRDSLKKLLKKENRFKIPSQSNQQVISGFFIIIFVSLHIIGYSLYHLIADIDSMNLIYFAVDNLLFLSIGLHLRVSIPRWFVSFGFLEREESYQRCKSLVNVLVFLALAILLLAEIIYYLL